MTQQFNTTTSMGRLTLNVLLSFAQFEREVTSERIRDKISASKRKGLWVGGMAPLGCIELLSCRIDVLLGRVDLGPPKSGLAEVLGRALGVGGTLSVRR